MKKLPALLSIAILLTTLHSHASEEPAKLVAPNCAVAPAHRLDSSGWKNRHQKITQNVQSGDPKLVLIGDSITHNFDQNSHADLRKKYLDQYNTVNLGISGDRTENVIWRLQNGALDGIKPMVATLLIGTNNTDGNHYLKISTPEELAAGIWKICSIVREMSPDTEIVLLGILPYGYKANHRDETNMATNKIIAQFPNNDSKIHYHDLGHLFLKKEGWGKVRKDLMPDHLHPNVAGSELMLKTLAPIISTLMEK
jgi:beta-glucosidase